MRRCPWTNIEKLLFLIGTEKTFNYLESYYSLSHIWDSSAPVLIAGDIATNDDIPRLNRKWYFYTDFSELSAPLVFNCGKRQENKNCTKICDDSCNQPCYYFKFPRRFKYPGVNSTVILADKYFSRTVSLDSNKHKRNCDFSKTF